MCPKARVEPPTPQRDDSFGDHLSKPLSETGIISDWSDDDRSGDAELDPLLQGVGAQTRDREKATEALASFAQNKRSRSNSFQEGSVKETRAALMFVEMASVSQCERLDDHGGLFGDCVV